MGELLKRQLPIEIAKDKSSEMKNNFWIVFILCGCLAMLPGCERKAPEQAAQSSSDTTSESGIEMVLIQGGAFTMGDTDEIDATPHEVTISPFYIDKHLVTQEQYEQVMGDNPSRWKGPKNPVEQVRWSDAVRFCNKRSTLEGLAPCYDLETWQCNFEAGGYRLPTEAEWEYACRAGTQGAYASGNDSSKLADYAWFDKNSGGHPQPVGTKKPNAWGLYDMCGNLWQWCNDFYQVDYYQQSRKDDPRGPKTGETKIVRGGCWKSSADSCKAGYRYNENPGYADVCFGYDIYGFRCVSNAPPTATQ